MDTETFDIRRATDRDEGFIMSSLLSEARKTEICTHIPPYVRRIPEALSALLKLCIYDGDIAVACLREHPEVCVGWASVCGSVQDNVQANSADLTLDSEPEYTETRDTLSDTETVPRDRETASPVTSLETRASHAQNDARAQSLLLRFAFVKGTLRRNGIATALLSSLGIQRGSSFSYLLCPRDASPFVARYPRAVSLLKVRS